MIIILLAIVAHSIRKEFSAAFSVSMIEQNPSQFSFRHCEVDTS